MCIGRVLNRPVWVFIKILNTGAHSAFRARRENRTYAHVRIVPSSVPAAVSFELPGFLLELTSSVANTQLPGTSEPAVLSRISTWLALTFTPCASVGGGGSFCISPLCRWRNIFIVEHARRRRRHVGRARRVYGANNGRECD